MKIKLLVQVQKFINFLVFVFMYFYELQYIFQNGVSEFNSSLNSNIGKQFHF